MYHVLQIIRYVEAEIPRSVEEQLAEWMAIVDKEQRRLVKPEDVAKILYLKDHYISDEHLQPYRYTDIEAAKKYITGKLREREK